MSNMTQQDVDFGVEAARQQWDLLLSESGKTQTMFIATDKKASALLAEYESIREYVEAEGLKMPQLIEGVTVNLT